MPPGDELSLQLPGLRLAARSFGRDDGPRVLALHGWLDHADSFTPLAERLASRHVVALDLPGHGRSEHHPPGYGYLFVDQAARVVQAMDALGWARCTLLGHSLGGALAAVVAGTIPQRVERLVLLDALGPLVEEPEGAPGRLAQALDQERSTARRKERVYPTLEDARAAWDRARFAMAPVARAALFERAVRRTPRGVAWAADPRLRLPSRLRLTEAQVQAFLRAIQAPTLLVVPASGVLADLPPERLAARRACVPHLHEVSVPGGHHAHLSHVEAVAGAIQAFFGAQPGEDAT